MTLCCWKLLHTVSSVQSTKRKKFPAFERIRPLSMSLSSSSDTECAVANFFGVSTSSSPLSFSSWGPIQLNKFVLIKQYSVRKYSQEMSQNQNGISSRFFKPKLKPKFVLLNWVPGGRWRRRRGSSYRGPAGSQGLLWYHFCRRSLRWRRLSLFLQHESRWWAPPRGRRRPQQVPYPRLDLYRQDQD